MLWWSVHILPICCAKCAPRNGVFTSLGTIAILNQRAEFLLWKEPILKSITFNRCLTIKSLWCCLLLVGWPNIQFLLWRLGSCHEITFLYPKVLPPMITWCAPPLALQQMFSAQLFFGCLFAYPSPSALRMKWHSIFHHVEIISRKKERGPFSRKRRGKTPLLNDQRNG